MKTRKLLAILVAVAMIVTMLPVVASAAATAVSTVSATYVATAFDGTNVTADVTYTFSVDVAAEGTETVYLRLLDPTNNVVAATSRTLAAGEKDGIEAVAEGATLTDGVEYTVQAKVGAFADPVDPNDYDAQSTLSVDSMAFSAAGSTVIVDKTEVDTGEEVTFTVRFRDGTSLMPNKPVSFYVKSTRDAEYITSVQGVATGSTTTIETEELIETVTDSKSDVKFKVKSGIAGSATISVYKWDGAGKITDDGLLIGKETITFKSDEKVASVQLSVSDDVVNGKITAGKKFDLEAEVLDAQNYWVADQEVVFYERFRDSETKSWGSWKRIGSAETDSTGVAELSVRRDKAGFYEFYAKAGTKDSRVDGAGTPVEVIAAAAYSVKAKDDVKYAELDEEATIEFVYRDRYGSKVDPGADADDIEISDPSGDDFDVDSVTINSDTELEVKFTPDEKGNYYVRAYIPDTGIYAETKVVVAEFGEVERIGLKLYDMAENKIDNAAVRVYDDDNDENTFEVRVFKYDENGIERRVDDEVFFSTSNARIATVDNDGIVTLKKDASGVVTITAIHSETGKTATLDITVSGAPVVIEAEVEVNDLTATVDMLFRDKDGNLAVETEGKEGYRVVVPEGLEVSDKDDFDNGKASFTLEATEYGTYSVRVVTDEGLAKVFDVVFGAPKAVAGANKVVLTIGGTFGFVDGAVTSLDAPAFIEEGRTFVPVRFIAEAFGAEADWTPKDGPVETVYLERDDMTITIGIGDEFLTVTKDGEAEVVTFSGAARIVDGRTYLPFRAIAEAFGAEVDYGPADGPVEWVSFEQ